MTKSLETLSSEYETALAAHQDDLGNDKKRQAADRAGARLNQAREQARQGRDGIGVVARDNDGDEG
jgi:isoaspartyl peptidase/L-asparaginase-like protein (Ntn-hydrolase superfamily)